MYPARRGVRYRRERTGRPNSRIRSAGRARARPAPRARALRRRRRESPGDSLVKNSWSNESTRHCGPLVQTLHSVCDLLLRKNVADAAPVRGNSSHHGETSGPRIDGRRGARRREAGIRSNDAERRRHPGRQRARAIEVRQLPSRRRQGTDDAHLVPPRDDGGLGTHDPGPDGRPPDNRHPVDRALEHLTKTYPLQTSEWSAWSAAMQPPKLAGRWAVVGSQLGKGAIYGQVTVAADASAPDSFTTEIRYTVARTGESVSRSGKALVYTGYQWRGRGNDWRDVLFVERDWKEMWGRWFSGAYDETGIDVKLTRLSSDPVVFGTSATATKRGPTG